MGKRNNTTQLMLPLDVVEAAAERANAEQRSLTEVIVTLLRDFTAGRTYLNLPDGGSERERLEAAERVCVLYGWSALGDGSDRSKALHELWSEWDDLPGTDSSSAGNPELSDERIAELARRRDETRARTLERIRAEGR